MNKLIIICGSDRVGKGALIKGLCKYHDYKNISVRHCDKPLKNLSNKEAFDYQMKSFEQELQLIDYLQSMNRKFMYHGNIIIYDRFYLGEYVYGQLFREGDPNEIKNEIIKLENFYIKNYKWLKVYLVLLMANPEFLLEKDDGESLSKDIEQKTKELKLFREAYDFSLIKNKTIINVENNGVFRRKEDILNDVIMFIQ